MKRVLAIVALSACAPEVDEAAWRINDVRILAVKAEPPEAEPSSRVEFHALVASPEGTLNPSLDFAFCTEPKPVDENNIVARECLEESVTPISDGEGIVARGLIPFNSCSLFGPDPPPGNLRARDPDVTGGYYQPLRVSGAGTPAIAMERIRCNLARANPEVAGVYRNSPKNGNPAIVSLSLGPHDLDHLPPGTSISLEVSFTPESIERYLVFDVQEGSLIETTETLVVSWFTSKGELATRRSSGANTLTTPSEPGIFHLWVVLRDDRGGLDFASYEANVVGP